MLDLVAIVETALSIEAMKIDMVEEGMDKMRGEGVLDRSTNPLLRDHASS